jgi:hypothetical protein
LTKQFQALLDAACRYRDAKKVADYHREFNIVSEQEEAKENETRRAFAQAYKAFDEKRTAAS